VRSDSGVGLGLAAKPLVCGSDSTLVVAPFEPVHDVRTRVKHFVKAMPTPARSEFVCNISAFIASDAQARVWPQIISWLKSQG
jgi:hypothetical protein